jgi:hypothetical protein
VSAAIETSKITFVLTGRTQESFDGTSTLCLFDFLEDYKNIPHFVENLQAEMRRPGQARSSLVTFVDTPGLIPDKNRLPFDCEEIMLKLAGHAEQILVFMDPIGQAFSPSLQEFVAKAHPENGRRMHFFLTKADTIDEADCTRIISSISQTLSHRITQRTLDVRPMSLPRGKETTIDEKSNAISLVCEIIEGAVHNRVQANRSQLAEDLSNVTRAAEGALFTLSTRRNRFRVASLLMFLIIPYFIAATQLDDVPFFPGLPFLALASDAIWIITLIFKPDGEEMRTISGFLDSTARTAKIKLGEYFDQLTNPDE